MSKDEASSLYFRYQRKHLASLQLHRCCLEPLPDSLAVEEDMVPMILVLCHIED